MSTPTAIELRELDVWIATNIFGWIKITDKPHPTDNRAIGGALFSPPGCDCDCNQLSYPPHYTTDPAAAMLVLEKILLRGWTITELCHHDDAGFAIEATVGNRTEEAWGETLPLAICRFARKVFEKRL